LDLVKKQLIERDGKISPKDQENIDIVENEYDDVMDILSNFGQEKITDCLQV